MLHVAQCERRLLIETTVGAAETMGWVAEVGMIQAKAEGESGGEGGKMYWPSSAV